MKKINSVNVTVKSLVAGLVLAGAANVSAYEAGDMIFRAGAISVQPDDSSSGLNVNGDDLLASDAGVDHDEQLGLTFTYLFNSHWGVELLAATPFDHDISVDLGDGNWISAGSTKHLPPTLSLQYFPMGAGSNLQPYVGLGVNYTTFFEEDLSGDLGAALGGGDTELDDSFGFAFQLGVDYQLNENWLLNAAVWKIDIETDAKITSADGTVVIKSDVEIDPIVYMVSLGYKF